MQTHELDMAAICRLKWPIRAVRRSDGLIACSRPMRTCTTHLDFNLRRPICQRRNVRVALAYATTARRSSTRSFTARRFPPDRPVADIVGVYTNDSTYPYDPAKARRRCSTHWVGRSGRDGIRVKNGERLEFTLSTQTESTHGHQIQTYLQRDWRDVGVEADIKNYPTSQFFDNSASGILQGGHYDVAGFSWAGAADPDDSAIYSGRQLRAARAERDVLEQRIATRAMNDALTDRGPGRAASRDYVIVQQQLATDVPTIILYFGAPVASTTAISRVSTRRPSSRHFGIPGSTRSSDSTGAST